MTKQEAALARGIKSFDLALPQPWVDDAREIVGGEPAAHFVWSYDVPGILGAPAPVTNEGDRMEMALRAAGIVLFTYAEILAVG